MMSETVVGWYGKVPLSREFLRRNAAGPEVRALDHWVQEGLNHAQRQLGTEWKKAYRAGETWNFLYAPEQERRALIGTCALTCDEAGREFPFFLFLRMEKPQIPESVPLLPYAVRDFLHNTRPLVESRWKDSNLQKFTEDLQGIPVSEPEDWDMVHRKYEQFLQEQTTKDFWTSILGTFEHEGKYRLEGGLISTRSSVGQGKNGVLPWGLKFPLMQTMKEEAFDVPFWVDLSKRHLGIHQDPSVLLWNRQSSTGTPSLLMVFGRPSAQVIMFLTSPDKESDAWFDVIPSIMNSNGGWSSSLSEDDRRVMDDERLSVNALLVHAEKGGARN